MSYWAIICWLCMTTQISRPENTRNTSEKNQQGWSSPSFGVSRLEKIPLCFVNLTDKLETLWALLAGLPASYSPTWAGTGRVSHLPWAHQAQSRSPRCSHRELWGDPSSSNRGWCTPYSPSWRGVFISLLSLGHSPCLSVAQGAQAGPSAGPSACPTEDTAGTGVRHTQEHTLSCCFTCLNHNMAFHQRPLFHKDKNRILLPISLMLHRPAD